MANEKKVFSASDAHPAILYAKRDPASELAYPILADSVGHLIISGLVPVEFDHIDLTYTGENLTGVVYKLGGSGGPSVATLTLAYSGSTLTSVTRT